MQYDFRVDILRNYVKIGEIRTESVFLKYDYNSEVMRGLQLDMKATKMDAPGLVFDMFKDRIRPVLIEDGRENPLGVFMVMAAPETRSDTEDYVSIEGYDETMLVKQAAFEERQYYAAGTQFITIIQQILTSLNLPNVYVEPNDAVLSVDLEAAVGENCLTFINGLLDAINYQHLYADSTGMINLRKVVNPTEPQFIYRDGYAFNITPPVKVETDIYNLPNVVIGVYSSPDQDPIVYKRVNDDAMSVISTVNRGYKVVRKVELRNAASAEDLQDYVDRMAFEAMQTTEKVTFSTLVESGHEPSAALQLDTDAVKGLFIEKSWEMRISQNDFSMSHTAERKVFV